MRDILSSTREYENWLAEKTDVSERALKRKHRKMAASAFAFLRASFYRWVERWPEICPELAARDRDVLLCVGDLHTENFGTWRDSRGRLVFGINDFDEACEAPFSQDLVRLAASAMLAVDEHSLATPAPAIPDLLLRGYRGCLDAGGAPLVLRGAGSSPFDLPLGEPEDAEAFWRKKLDDEDAPVVDETELPDVIVEIFRAAFPPGTRVEFRRQRKTGGLGSLGRRRYSAIWNSPNGRLAREIKALVPSAAYWLQRRDSMPSQTASLLQRVIREPDPNLQVYEHWLLRQLAPDAEKINLASLPDAGRAGFEPELIQAMGWEAANVHLGSWSPARLGDALHLIEREFRPDWLAHAASAMAGCMREDHRAFAEAAIDQ
ncbi:MAG: DUF2252 family protein [Methylotetracoccus sp.]